MGFSPLKINYNIYQRSICKNPYKFFILTIKTSDVANGGHFELRVVGYVNTIHLLWNIHNLVTRLLILTSLRNPTNVLLIQADR